MGPGDSSSYKKKKKRPSRTVEIEAGGPVIIIKLAY